MCLTVELPAAGSVAAPVEANRRAEINLAGYLDHLTGSMAPTMAGPSDLFSIGLGGYTTNSPPNKVLVFALNHLAEAPVWQLGV